MPSTFSLKILHDDSPENPFTEWDCEPPLMYQTQDHYRRDTTHYGTTSIISELLDLITPRRLTLNRKEIIDALDIRSEEEIREYKGDDQTFTDALTDELIGNDDNLDLVEALARISKTPYLRYDSRGYSQGDYADVLIILTPSWYKKIGANVRKENDVHAKQTLESTRQLFDAWIWGDVYGYQLTEHKPLYTGVCHYKDKTLGNILVSGTLQECEDARVYHQFADHIIEQELSTETEDDIIDSCWATINDDSIKLTSTSKSSLLGSMRVLLSSRH